MIGFSVGNKSVTPVRVEPVGAQGASVYVALSADGAMMKIGHSTSPAKRITQLPQKFADHAGVEVRFRTVGEAKGAERALQLFMRAHRVQLAKCEGHTEWFDASRYDAVLELLRSMQDWWGFEWIRDLRSADPKIRYVRVVADPEKVAASKLAALAKVEAFLNTVHWSARSGSEYIFRSREDFPYLTLNDVNGAARPLWFEGQKSHNGDYWMIRFVLNELGPLSEAPHVDAIIRRLEAAAPSRPRLVELVRRRRFGWPGPALDVYSVER